MSNGTKTYITHEGDPSLEDLEGSMTAQGPKIKTYTSNNLGVATVNNRNVHPPPLNCVLTFVKDGTTYKYTLCGRPFSASSDNVFLGNGHKGEVECPHPGPPFAAGDDWVASAVTFVPPGSKGAKKSAGKKSASKKSAKKPASKKSTSKKAAKKPAGKKR